MIYLIGIGLEKRMVNFIYLSDRSDSGRLFPDYHDCIIDKCEGDDIDIAIINAYNFHKDAYVGMYADKYGRTVFLYEYNGEERWIEDLKPPRSERQYLIGRGFPSQFLGEYSRKKAIEYYHRLYEDEDLGIRIDT